MVFVAYFAKLDANKPGFVSSVIDKCWLISSWCEDSFIVSTLLWHPFKLFPVSLFIYHHQDISYDNLSSQLIEIESRIRIVYSYRLVILENLIRNGFTRPLLHRKALVFLGMMLWRYYGHIVTLHLNFLSYMSNN